MSELSSISLAGPAGFHVEDAVRDRYSSASQKTEACLCSAVEYDRQYLNVLPAEILDRDYGCGDPTRDVRPGETVLDLGSGGGKVCYIASQIVGPQGRVIGVDMNDEMLRLARQFQDEVGRRIGWHNVRFHKGRIQDLALDLDRLEERLKARPANSAAAWLETQRFIDDVRQREPMIATGSVDVVLSNCVLNLVQPRDRHQLFCELHRVLKPIGRAVISDIVSNQPVPPQLRDDPQLWSGCISGAFEESEFLAAFRSAGFGEVELVTRQTEPWQVVHEIEFRSVTVRATKIANQAAPLPIAACCEPGGCC